MARTILTNSHSNLNLSRRQTFIFQNLILIGNEMAKELNRLEHELTMGKDTKLTQKWSSLMTELATMLI